MEPKLQDESNRIQSVSGYLDALKSVASCIPGEPETYLCQLVFRGQPSTSYELLPSVARGGKGWLPNEGVVPAEQKMLANEGNYIAAACHRLPSLFNDGLSPVDLLARLQHCGIPTRLLDVTTNALAALYFACAGNGDNGRSPDGEVIVFRCPMYDLVDYPMVQAIADSWRILPNARVLSSFVELAIEQPYFCYQKKLLQETRESTGSLEDWAARCCGHLLFVRGSAGLKRQSSQSGMYILFPNSIGGYGLEGERDGRPLEFKSRIEEIPKDHESIAARVTVDAGSKKDILRELRTLGITEGSLFPDSVDAICKDIKLQVDGLQ